MGDDQVEQKPKTRLGRLADKALESVVAALITCLIIGFFAVIWQTNNATNKDITSLSQRQDDANRALRATTDTLTLEVAKLHVQSDQLQEIIQNQRTELNHLRDYIGKYRPTNQPPPVAPTIPTSGLKIGSLDIIQTKSAIDKIITDKKNSKD